MDSFKCPNCSLEITVIDVQCPYCDYYFGNVDIDSLESPENIGTIARHTTNEQLVSAKVQCLACGHVFASTWFTGVECSHRCPECGMDETIVEDDFD